jgi:DNA primase
MSTIDEIKSRIDIVDLVSETVKLRRSGKPTSQDKHAENFRKPEW